MRDGGNANPEIFQVSALNFRGNGSESLGADRALPPYLHETLNNSIPN
jgi:hypothetical protein